MPMSQKTHATRINSKMPHKEKQYKILICGDELVELKNHIHDIPECRSLIPRILKYKGDKPFLFTADELSWVVALLEAVIKDPQGYCIINHETMDLEYVAKTDVRYKTCRSLFRRLEKEYTAIMDKIIKKAKAFRAKEEKLRIKKESKGK